MVGPRLTRLSQQSQPRMRHHCRGAARRRLPHLHVRQVARHALRRAEGRQLQLASCSAASRSSTAPSAATATSSIRSSLCRQNTFITPENDPEYKPKQFYYTDALSDNAVRFLQQHQQESPDKPFFMYVAYTAAHWPMQALEKDIAKYKGKFDGGYEPLRQARLERLKKLGLIDPKWECRPHRRRLGGRQTQSLGSPLHGSLCRDDRQHGPGHRAHRGRTEAHRAASTTPSSSTCKTTAAAPRTWAAPGCQSRRRRI